MKPKHQLVLRYLASLETRLGSAYPRQSSIASAVGISERTVQRALSELSAVGLVTVRVRKARNGYNLTNGYRISQDVRKLIDPGGEGANLAHREGAAHDSLARRIAVVQDEHSMGEGDRMAHGSDEAHDNVTRGISPDQNGVSGGEGDRMAPPIRGMVLAPPDLPGVAAPPQGATPKTKMNLITQRYLDDQANAKRLRRLRAAYLAKAEADYADGLDIEWDFPEDALAKKLALIKAETAARMSRVS